MHSFFLPRALFSILVCRKKEKERRKKRKLENPSQPSDKITRSQLKECKMSNSSCKVSIAIDLSLEKFMDERSLSKCIKQISRCYSINRRASNPVQFYVTSLEGKSLVEISKNQGYDKWDVSYITPFMLCWYVADAYGSFTLTGLF